MGGLDSVGEVSSYMKESEGEGGGEMLFTKKKKTEIFMNKDGIKDNKKLQHDVKLLSPGGGQRESLQT